MNDSALSKLRQETVAGIGWNAGSRIAGQVLQFVIGVILARLLSPAAFGLIGMLVVFTGFASIFTNLGFGSALIQKQDAKPEHYYSVFWINVGAGLALMLVFMALSPTIARFYGQSAL